MVGCTQLHAYNAGNSSAKDSIGDHCNATFWKAAREQVCQRSAVPKGAVSRVWARRL
jgi:hypothetical protein